MTVRWHWAAWALAGTGLIAGRADSQMPTPPVVRSGYECQITQKFLAPGRYGQRPQFKNLTRPKDPPQTWPSDAAGGPEIIEAQANVELDGRISRVQIVWLQSGTMGFPYSVRADLDGIVMQMDYEWREQPGKASAPAPFDPDRIMVEISAQEHKKIAVPLALRLNRYPVDTEQLGGLAAIPAWQHSASITLPWPRLRAFANGASEVNFQLTALSVKPGQGLFEKLIRVGQLDLTPIPAVLERFVAADAMIRARAADAAAQCRKIETDEFDI